MGGHPLTLVKPTATKAARAGFFTVAVITPWNKLSAVFVMAPSLDSFKARLDDALSDRRGGGDHFVLISFS